MDFGELREIIEGDSKKVGLDKYGFDRGRFFVAGASDSCQFETGRVGFVIRSERGEIREIGMYGLNPARGYSKGSADFHLTKTAAEQCGVDISGEAPFNAGNEDGRNYASFVRKILACEEKYIWEGFKGICAAQDKYIELLKNGGSFEEIKVEDKRQQVEKLTERLIGDHVLGEANYARGYDEKFDEIESTGPPRRTKDITKKFKPNFKHRKKRACFRKNSRYYNILTTKDGRRMSAGSRIWELGAEKNRIVDLKTGATAELIWDDVAEQLDIESGYVESLGEEFSHFDAPSVAGKYNGTVNGYGEFVGPLIPAMSEAEGRNKLRGKRYNLISRKAKNARGDEHYRKSVKYGNEKISVQELIWKLRSEGMIWKKVMGIVNGVSRLNLRVDAVKERYYKIRDEGRVVL